MAALGRTQLSPPSQIRRRSRLPPLWHLLCQQWNCPQSLLLRQQMLRTSSRPPPGSLTPWLASPSRFDSTKDGLLRVRVPCSAIMMMRCAVHASHASTTMPCVTVQRQALPRLAMRTLLSIPFCASSIGATPARWAAATLTSAGIQMVWSTHRTPGATALKGLLHGRWRGSAGWSAAGFTLATPMAQSGHLCRLRRVPDCVTSPACIVIVAPRAPTCLCARTASMRPRGSGGVTRWQICVAIACGSQVSALAALPCRLCQRHLVGNAVGMAEACKQIWCERIVSVV